MIRQGAPSVSLRCRLVYLALLVVACGSGTQAEVQFALKNYSAALEQAEADLAPGAMVDATSPVSNHLIALKSLARLGEFQSQATYLDQRVRAHETALDSLLVPESPERATVQWAVGSYLLGTYRLREAHRYMVLAQKSAHKTHNVEIDLRAQQGLSQIQFAMGRLKETASILTDTWTSWAAVVSERGMRENLGLLDAYLWFLDHYMHRMQEFESVCPLHDQASFPWCAAVSDDSTSFDAAWKRMQEALDLKWGFSDKFNLSPVYREDGLMRRSVLQLRAAVLFARRSRTVRTDTSKNERESRRHNYESWARTLFERVLSELDLYGGNVSRDPLLNRILCAKAQIEGALGGWDKAAVTASDCLAGAGAERDRGFMVQEQLPALAEIFEKAGQLSRAAELYVQEAQRFEEFRRSIPMEERESFFQGPARLPWAGLMRIRMHQYLATRGNDKLQEFLAAMDGMRARQLYEMVSGGQQSPLPSLELLRPAMPARAGLLLTAMAESELELILFTGSAVRAASYPVTSADLANSVRLALRELTLPGLPEVPKKKSAISELSHYLLEPFQREVANIDRLTIVADGALAAFPLDTLMVGQAHLGAETTVAYSPSLAFLMRDEKKEQRPGFYAFVDPFFGAGFDANPGLNVANGSNEGTPRLEQYYQQPLAATREWAESIAALFPRLRSSIVHGKDATEATFCNLPSQGFTHLLIGTHGKAADNNEPYLLLAKDARNDGYLTFSEISKLRFENTLTVLASCESAKGEVLPGEGVLGLSRAFLAAGSRGVVAALWSVPSAPTGALLDHFFRYQLAGIDAPRALSMAKRRVAANPDWREARNWAAFTLIAEGGLLKEGGGPNVPRGRYSNDFQCDAALD